jgi:2-amino-4-hydroxy-6-hydroxymethyldihydropteridine diphosphokinase
MRAVLALGSNLGDRGATVVEALRRLALVEGVQLVAASELLETVALTPRGPDPDAPRYLNGVVIVDTSLTPEQLLTEANAIESALGRVRGEQRWADRTIDLDLIQYEGETRETAALTLPHPRAAERSFVLAPWLSIDPEAELAGVRVSELLARLEGS